MPSQYTPTRDSVSRMLWSVNGAVSGPAMVVSPVPEVRPADVVASAVAKQMERLQILERRCEAGNAFSVPMIVCEDVDGDQAPQRTSSPDPSSQTTLTRLSPGCCPRRYLQVPGIDVGVERRPPS
ncbi:hypothetical protein HPB48_008806 [Haemaphysalis longicornis]|uniref:Uncharacterized protein n=1 Tax=Haemaphysalis longicornis TaxID=44386 RepID=A0A9J6GYA2_HAELO|nr:hypothetical protein HPB48_008806 [Haemaphysalis longicornis]